MEILTSTAGTIGGEIAKYTLVPLGRQIGYLIFYNGNVIDLVEVLNELNHKKTAIDLVINAAESNLHIPDPDMKNWRQKVDSVNGRAIKFLEKEINQNRKCLRGLCPNPKSRYLLSRKASKMKQEIDRLLTEYQIYRQNVLSAPAQLSLDPIFNSEYAYEFRSRSLTMKKILNALADDNRSMVSICGQGGVGKTTMVGMLMQTVKSEKLFDEVAMAVVSQTPDVKKILGDIAACLGLTFEAENNEQERSVKLYERIIGKCEKRILLILDDVWKEEDFKRLRVPPAGKRAGYKILLTSRKEDECKKIGCLLETPSTIAKKYKNVCLDPLSKEEGRNLFKEIAFAGSSTSHNGHQWANDIADECKGLPIAIAAIAQALNGGDESAWKHTLTQLKISNLNDTPEMKSMCSKLELSYNRLEHEDAKACFLLCGIFPEDYDIPVEDLVRYMVGLELIPNDTITIARDRVGYLIGKLKGSFLLLNSDKKDGRYVKMHDVLRDVAISIAARDKQYLVNCNNTISDWPSTWNDSYHNCAAISLWRNKIENNDLDHLECPNLQLLLLQSNGLFPDNFFHVLKKLKVVDLKGCSPPKSLNEISEVRTLHLSHMQESEVGDLKKVKILKIGALLKLPRGVRSMRHLRLLDLRSADMLQYFPEGILSKLSILEELYVSLKFVKWELNEGGEKKNASLKELKASLITLEIGISNSSHLPGSSIFKKLENFKIVHHYKAWSLEDGEKLVYNKSFSRKSGNALTLTGDASELTSRGIDVLLKKTEDLELKNVKNLQSDLYELGGDGFPTLKTLQMDGCNKMEHLVDGKNMKEKCFSMLKEIHIAHCDTLKFLFPTVVATRLSRSLESIHVSLCDEISGIFNGKEESDDVEFPNLRQIYLWNLPNLKGLWTHKSNDHQEVKSNCLERQSCTLFPSSWIVFSSLKVLVLGTCPLMKVVFPICAAEKLLHLQDLTICYCNQVEYVVGWKEENTDKTLILPKLTKVLLEDLPELVSFCAHNHVFLDWSSLVDIKIRKCPKIQTIIAYNPSLPIQDRQLVLLKIPSDFQDSLKLERVETSDCANLRHLFPSRAAKLLVKLEQCIIFENRILEQVIGKEEGDDEATKTMEKISFSQLKYVELKDNPNMSCFYGGTYAMEFPLLEDLVITQCRSMKTFTCGPLLPTSKLMKIFIDYESINLTIGDLNMKVREEMLRELYFNKDEDLKRISLQHLSNEEMSKVQKVKIHNCEQLLNVVPCNLIAALQKVEIFDVKDCYSMNEIFEFNGANVEKENVAVSSHLQKLILANLRNLEHVFNKIPASVIVFGKLELLSIDSCNILENIFSVSAVRGLIQLEKLIISSCANLEEIIAEGNSEEKAASDKIVLPQLLSVEISGVPRLQYFYRGNCTLELLSLRSIKLNGHKMESFSNGTVITPELKQVQINEIDEPHSGDLNGDFKIQKFKKVDIENIEDVTKILTSSYSSGIKHLIISMHYYWLSNVIPYNLIRNIEKLEKLTMECSTSVEEIFEYKGGNTEETSVSVILNLEEISLRNLHNLKHIFSRIPSSVVSFQKLRKLEICHCCNLKYIFSISSIKDLIQLEELNISDSDTLEQIVVEEGGDGGDNDEEGDDDDDNDNDDNEEETEENKEIEDKEEVEEEIADKVEFRQLRRINISCGRKDFFRLKCFYKGKYALQFPLLESLSLNGCYGMTSFSNGLLTTPMLQQVHVNEKDYACPGDLNQVLKNRMLETVVALNDEHFSRIIRIASEASSQILSLNYVNEKDDPTLRYYYEAMEKGLRAIPCSVIQNLEQIRIKHCDSLEVIFELDKETAFSTLERISLDSMENLKYIFNKIPQGFIGFQQLKILQIESCRKLKYLFPVSIARGLLQLQHIYICACSNMEQIIAEEEAGPLANKIELPQLKSIDVVDAYNLECFYNGICHIELPKLKLFSIRNSEGIKCFSNGSVGTPLLENLEINFKIYPSSRNLNTDIREMDLSQW